MREKAVKVRSVLNDQSGNDFTSNHPITAESKKPSSLYGTFTALEYYN